MKPNLRLLTIVLILTLFISSFTMPTHAAHWEWQNPLPNGNNLGGVWRFGSEIFAVGSNGTILHFDGSVWLTMKSGTSENLNSIWGSSGTDVFAVGDAGGIIHYDGNAWSLMDTGGITSTLMGIWGSSAIDVFAVGIGGTILHFDGGTWKEMASNSSDDLYGVWGVDASNVYAAGYNGTVLHYNGYNWRQVASVGNDLRSIWGTSATDVWVADDTDFYHYDGFAWQPVVANFVQPNSIWGSSSDAFQVVTGQVGILRYLRNHYYVDNQAGDDANDGTSSGAGAWGTLHHAISEINLLPPGNYTLHVAAGRTYSGTNGEAGSGVNITQDHLLVMGEPGVLLDGELSAMSWDIGFIIDASEVVLRGLGLTRFQGDGNPGVVVNNGR